MPTTQISGTAIRWNTDEKFPPTRRRPMKENSGCARYEWNQINREALTGDGIASRCWQRWMVASGYGEAKRFPGEATTHSVFMVRDCAWFWRRRRWRWRARLWFHRRKGEKLIQREDFGWRRLVAACGPEEAEDPTPGERATLITGTHVAGCM
jgi:hypothetical protein